MKYKTLLLNYEYLKRNIFTAINYNLYSTICKKYNILFFGTDDFSVGSLRLLTKELKIGFINRLEVVTSVKKGNKVMEYARKENLKVHPWPLTLPVTKEFDLGVVVSFGHLIPERIIEYFPHGMINVHASLLPKWRGAAPVIHAILNGDEYTGVTIMRIKPKHFDIGEVILQRSVAISPSILMPDLRAYLANEGAVLLIECLKNLNACLENAKTQEPGQETHAPKASPALATIKWNGQTAQEVYNLHRALYGLYPLTTTWQGTTIKLFECSLCKTQLLETEPLKINSNEQRKPGFVYYNKKDKLIYVVCKDNCCVTFNSVRLLNKKTISSADFNNGFITKVDKDKHHFL